MVKLRQIKVSKLQWRFHHNGFARREVTPEEEESFIETDFSNQVATILLCSQHRNTRLLETPLLPVKRLSIILQKFVGKTKILLNMIYI